MATTGAVYVNMGKVKKRVEGVNARAVLSIIACAVVAVTRDVHLRQLLPQLSS